MIRRTTIVLATALAVGLAPTVLAAQKKVRPIAAPEKKDAGRWIGTRPVTVASGQVRVPTPDEASDLAASLKGMLDRSGAGTTTITRPDGARQITLESQFGSVVLARPTADGGFESRCVTSFDEAMAFLGLVVAEEQ